VTASVQSAAPVAPSRRARQRAATLAEIRSEARRLLVDGGEAAVSLRAVARQMGLTPAALYRYVDSHEELMQVLSVDIHDDLTAALEAARDQTPSPAAADRLREVSRRFRSWALDHPIEFGLIFANPMQAVWEQPCSDLEAAGQRMGSVFAELFGELVTSGQLPVPAVADVDADLLAAVLALGEQHLGTGKGELPPTVLVRFVECWTRLYGCVALEVSGQLHWAMTDTAPMFELTLRECADLLGVSELYAPLDR
jgi:AcrR family transcriptional regulator